jgi:hypothetical protein
MADKASSAAADHAEVGRLRRRVAQLEAEAKLNEKDQGRGQTSDATRVSDSTRRVSDSFSDVRRSKRDAADRMLRGVTLASVEAVRLFADTVSSFTDNVITRNEGRSGGGRSVRDMKTRLPEDIATSLADSVDQFVDIPRKAADRYSKVYREGEKEQERDKAEPENGRSQDLSVDRPAEEEQQPRHA